MLKKHTTHLKENNMKDPIKPTLHLVKKPNFKKEILDTTITIFLSSPPLGQSRYPLNLQGVRTLEGSVRLAHQIGFGELDHPQGVRTLEGRAHQIVDIIYKKSKWKKFKMWVLRFLELQPYFDYKKK